MQHVLQESAVFSSLSDVLSFCEWGFSTVCQGEQWDLERLGNCPRSLQRQKWDSSPCMLDSFFLQTFASLELCYYWKKKRKWLGEGGREEEGGWMRGWETRTGERSEGPGCLTIQVHILLPSLCWTSLILSFFLYDMDHLEMLWGACKIMQIRTLTQ